MSGTGTGGRNVAGNSGDLTADGLDFAGAALTSRPGVSLDLSGRIDVLINNAGVMTFADMLTVEDAV
jgi:NAD(P)-dependent dehydrogenase (short-subunit alcohol dehydrogenase family)